MKLYLKHVCPGGRRFRLVDPVSKKVDYHTAPVRIFHDKCDEDYPDSFAKKLLKQDGHVLDTKPYKPAVVNTNDGIDDNEMILILQNRANEFLGSDTKSLTVKDLDNWIKKLQVVGVDPKAKKEEKLDAIITQVENILGIQADDGADSAEAIEDDSEQ